MVSELGIYLHLTSTIVLFPRAISLSSHSYSSLVGQLPILIIAQVIKPTLVAVSTGCKAVCNILVHLVGFVGSGGGPANKSQ